MADFDPTGNRATLSEAQAADLSRLGVLAMDPNRTLPLWFDGRYLTARDLNRQQNYMLARHATLGRAIGHGVIEGLKVTLQDAGDASTQSRLTIAPGQGIAFDGAHIILPEEMVLNLADLAVQAALNARLGLSETPSAPSHSRSGLYVLSLRAVEYTANQTTAYPTHVTGERTSHMGDRVEAVAATLTPYTAFDVSLDSAEARAAAAQRIFGSGAIDGVPGHALPLAMLSLRYGVVEWIDTHLVRRELVASRRDFLGLGLDAQQLRLAHYRQYRDALSDVMKIYADNALPARFPAEQHFRILPAAGPLPADTIDAAGQAQVFFPGEVEVELSLIPEDELPALIEESFELPPIDLTLPVADRDTLSVMVVAPIPREGLRKMLSGLSRLNVPLRPLSMLGQGPQKPIDRLGAMKITLADAGAMRRVASDPVTAEWAAVVGEMTNFGIDPGSGDQVLWYMRRRTLRRSADLESVLVPVDTRPVVDPTPVPGGGDGGDGGTPAPTPDPTPQPDPLPDVVESALMKLEGFGELRKIAEVQLRRVNAPVGEVFASAILDTPLAKQPIAVVALVARMAAGAANASAKLKSAAESLAGAEAEGMAVLSAALIGGGSNAVSRQRFDQLQFVLTEDGMLETLATDIAAVGGQDARRLASDLNKVVTLGDKDATVETAKEIAKLADERRHPPEPTPVTDPNADAAAAAEAARLKAEEERRRAEAAAAARAAAEAKARREAEALVRSLPEKADQDRLRSILDAAQPNIRDAVVARMNANKVPDSRIATAVALGILSGGGGVGSTQVAQLGRVDAKFVAGLAALEPVLLKVEAPAPQPAQPAQPVRRVTPGRAAIVRPGAAAALGNGRNFAAIVNRPLTGAALAAALLATARPSADTRVRLVAGARNVRDLAAFGFDNRGARAKLTKAAETVAKACDQKNATPASVAKVIALAVRGG